jgi:hypothetical protein
LRLELQEGIEVILDGTIVSTWSVRDSGKKDRLLGISLGDQVGIERVQGVVPEMEQVSDLVLSDFRSLPL